jgi:Tfp pilus assembly protein PilX
MIRLTSFCRRRRDDQGVALVTVMLAGLVVMGLTATIATLSVDNLRNAKNDRLSGSALGAADAGVAQAIDYIRGNGVSGLTCLQADLDADATACDSLPAGWASPSSPEAVALDSAGTGCATNAVTKNCAKVYITAATALEPPASKTGTYEIHSLGFYGSSPGARNVVVTIEVSPDTFPVGVFGKTVSGNGNTAVLTESLFSQGCVSPLVAANGNGLSFTGTDAYWDQPAAPHSTVGLSSTNNSSCPSNDRGLMPASTTHCTSGFVNAQSPTGGVVTSGSACYKTWTRTDGTTYPDGACPSGTPSIRADGLCETTGFSLTDLQRYGYRPRGLSDTQYAELKARSQSQGTYNLAESAISAALTTAQTNGSSDPVIDWDCNSASICSGGNVTVKVSDFPSMFRVDPSTVTSCSSLPIVTIVVEHGGLIIQGGNNDWIDSAIFAPDGLYNGNGGINVYGTIFSNNLQLGGNQTFELNNCWVTNFPGAALSVTQTSFREDDATDLQ